MTPTAQSATERELFSQPEIWARVLSDSPHHRAVLPQPGEPVLFVGCGTSYYIGESYARLRNAAGLGRTRAAIASEIPYVDDGETIAHLAHDYRDRSLECIGNRGEDLGACLFLAALHLAQVAECDTRLARDLAKGTALL